MKRRRRPWSPDATTSIVQIVSDDGRVVATDHEPVTTPLRTTPGSVRGVRVKGSRTRTSWWPSANVRVPA